MLLPGRVGNRISGSLPPPPPDAALGFQDSVVVGRWPKPPPPTLRYLAGNTKIVVAP